MTSQSLRSRYDRHFVGIHRVTITSFRSKSMPAGFRRHFVDKTLIIVSYCEIRFAGQLMILAKLS